MASNKRSIPEIRERLRELANLHNMDELRELADEMHRNPPAKARAPVRSQKLTPELAQEIRDYARANPQAHQQDIAEHFGVNHGRVSEALNNVV
ncbi:hypothetical protein SAMN02787020_1929 [Brevundimonas sp. 374]|nr:hypothetical protein SAMN02787020_1929 [Brevundimonas sp. 374]